MDKRPPFDIMRACFLLLAAILLTIVAETLIAVVGCAWLIVVQERAPPGGCAATGATVRDLLTESLTAVLALIAASRVGPPD